MPARLAWLISIVFCCLPVQSMRSADAELPAVNPGRYLLIVDTSSSMRRYAENASSALEKLLLSGMNGQLSEGDTIGVWTYNEDLYTGNFPLQHWKPELRQNITTEVTAFVKRQPFEKESHWEKVMPSLLRLVRESEKITVMFVSNGETKMVGSPFDRAINAIYDNSFEELKKQRDPFLTLLRAQRGRWIGYSVTWSPWPVEFPRFLPEAPKPVEASTTVAKEVKPPAEPPPVSKPTPKPLIVIGKKPEPPPVTATDTAKTPSEEPATAPTSEPMPPRQATTIQTTVESHAEEKPDAATASIAPVVEETTTSKIQHESSAQLPQIEPEQASSPSSEAVTAQAQTPPSQAAVAIQPQPKSRRSMYLVFGVSAIFGALGLAFFLMRNERKAPSASLITRSMEREK